MKHTPKLARRRWNWNCESTKVFGLNFVTLHHWDSQIWPYSTGFFSYDLSAWRYRIKYLLYFLIIRDARPELSFGFYWCSFVQHIQINNWILKWKGVTITFWNLRTFLWFRSVLCFVSATWRCWGERGGLMAHAMDRHEGGGGLTVALIASRGLWTSPTKGGKGTPPFSACQI